MNPFANQTSGAENGEGDGRVPTPWHALTLGGARTRAQQAVSSGVPAGVAAGNLVEEILRPWDKEGPDRDGHTFADRLFAHWVMVVEELPGMEWPAATILWMARRLISTDGPSVIRYLRHLSWRIASVVGTSPESHWAIKRFVKRLSQMRGCHRQAARPSLTTAQYNLFLRSDEIERWLRAAGVVCWRRMGRVADAAEMRVGGIWKVERPADVEAPETDVAVAVEIPFHKSKAAGAWDRVVMMMDQYEVSLMATYMTEEPPNTPPMSRPLLFPLLNAKVMAAALEAVLGQKMGAHVFRRGALRTALEGGTSLEEAILLSLHGTTESALAYILTPDSAVSGVMARASAALGFRPKR